ncbi:MAG: ABC transporter ATP-binding protein [Bdellovibrionaceae bacterium]|nr:ABC transporter ATP-binding protein [Pseudobdellovibrionaceae bacterium]
MSLALEIANLVKAYGSVVAVRSVSFSVAVGEIYGLLGPNGAGKTTLISTVTTLEKPDAGSVRVFGWDVEKNPREAKRLFGIVHQEIINSGFFTVQEILEFQSGFYGLRRNHDRIKFLLERLDLGRHAQKKVKQLSGGMKRRLMIAKALVHSPRLLLLDEPTAGVDIELRSSLWEFVRELRAEGTAVLLTTHYLEEAEKLCDRVGILHQGRLECEGKTREVVQRFTSREIDLYLRSPMTLVSPYVLSCEGHNFYRFMVPHGMALGDFLASLRLKTEDIADLQIREGSLEEAFRQVLKKQEISQ